MVMNIFKKFIFVMALFMVIPGIAWASDLVCDPQAGIKFYDVDINSTYV